MNTRIYITIFGLVIVAVFASASLDWLRSVGRTAIRPAESLSNATNQSRSWFTSLRDVDMLRQSVVDLEKQNTELESQVSVLTESIARTKRLETEINAATQFSKDRLVSARVIARSPLGVLDELIVNKGTNQGVSVGQPVLKSGFLVGVIHAASAETSSVTLIVSAQTSLPVVLQDSRGQGLLRGGLEGLLVTDLPVDVEIKPKERVLTSSLGNLLPPDIPIGQVEAIVSHDSEILQKVTLSSPIKFFGVEEVVIVFGKEAAQ